MGKKALVADIERASLSDGPGIRTTVFFKGCPLRCVWCHNPECISYEKEMLFYREKCIGCGKCEEGCFSGAKVVCGKEMSASEIIDEILLDAPYYGNLGGVTFSGGEALSYPEVLKEIISLCKQHSIRTCIETSLFLFEKDILADLDYVYADLKIWDDTLHQNYVGVSNEEIKRHFFMLDSLGVPFTVRTPVIPGINDDKDNIIQIATFVSRLKNAEQYELLQYNPLGESKRRALGQPEFVPPSPRVPFKELIQYAKLSR